MKTEEQLKIKRWDVITGEDYFDRHGYFRENVEKDDGEFVLFECHKKAIEEARQQGIEIGKKESLQTQTMEIMKEVPKLATASILVEMYNKCAKAERERLLNEIEEIIKKNDTHWAIAKIEDIIEHLRKES
jgi:hypothetical protein